VTWTIQTLLDWTKDYFKRNGIESARIDAEVLLSRLLNKKRIDLYVHFEEPIQPEDLKRFKSWVMRRVKHEPVQYILGETEFWSLSFALEPGVLIPRPETECLIEAALAIYQARKEETLSICDIGCGSGVMSIVLAKEFPAAHIVSVDISQKALDVTQKNAETHGVSDRITLIKSDLFSAIPSNQTFDVVISNPPYIKEGDWSDLEAKITEFEPKQAIVAGPEGTEVHVRILEAVHSFLKPKGTLIMEIAPGQRETLNDYLTNQSYLSDSVIKEDYEKRERVAIIKYG
jgi:release factor glutamine methyltransferase